MTAGEVHSAVVDISERFRDQPAAARAAFMATNAELISRATTVVLIAPPLEGADTASCAVLTLPGVCELSQAAALRALADGLEAEHTADCPF